MSHTFTDTEGRRWTFAVNVLTARRVKDELGIDLLAGLDPESDVFERLAGDVFTLFDVMACLLTDQLKERDLTSEDLGQSLDEQTCEQALRALVEALIDFFPPQKRKVLGRAFQRVWTAAEQQQTQALALADRTLDSPEFENLINEAVASMPGGPSSSSPPSPVSSPGGSPSGN